MNDHSPQVQVFPCSDLHSSSSYSYRIVTRHFSDVLVGGAGLVWDGGSEWPVNAFQKVYLVVPRVLDVKVSSEGL